MGYSHHRIPFNFSCLNVLLIKCFSIIYLNNLNKKKAITVIAAIAFDKLIYSF